MGKGYGARTQSYEEYIKDHNYYEENKKLKGRSVSKIAQEMRKRAIENASKYSQKGVDEEKDDVYRKINKNGKTRSERFAKVREDMQTRNELMADNWDNKDRFDENGRDKWKDEKVEIPGFKDYLYNQTTGEVELKNSVNNKEIEDDIKSLYIYQDEKNMGSLDKEPLKRYYDKYGKENVDKVWKEMDDKYAIIKGSYMDSEGLTYNSLVERSKYSDEAIKNYQNRMADIKSKYWDRKEYNKQADIAKEEFEKMETNENVDKEYEERQAYSRKVKEEVRKSMNEKYNIKDEDFKNLSEDMQKKINDEEANLISSKMNKYDYDKTKNSKYDKQYSSVVERYNKDEEFRNMLKNEHQKDLDATRKEIKAYLDTDMETRKNNGLENEDDLFRTMQDYWNIDREDFDKILNEELINYSKTPKEFTTKPLESSYSGYGWKGSNFSNMSTKDEAKLITDEFKKLYPDIKVSRKSSDYSGGSSIDFSIMESKKDIFVNKEDIDKMGYKDFGNLSASRDFENWASNNSESYKKDRTYNINDVRNYAKEKLDYVKSKETQFASGNEWYFNEYGKGAIKQLNDIAKSYTYDDSDAMTDYFDHGTYMRVNVGKWNKPYKVSEEKTISNFKRRKGAK